MCEKLVGIVFILIIKVSHIL